MKRPVNASVWLFAARGITLLWILVKLTLITAMMSRNTTEFIYAGF